MPAKMIPPTWSDPRPNREAERYIFESLAQLDESYTIFHDRAWVGKRPSQRVPFVQCDFIICHENLGIIAVEVKGGKRFRCKDGVWSGQRHSGEWFQYKLPPHQQAYEAAFLLRTIMKDVTSGRFPDYVIAHAVCFPQADVQEVDLDKTVDRAIIIDRSDTFNLADTLQRVCMYWREQNVLRRASQRAWIPLSAITQIREHLARDIDIRALLGTSIAIEQQDRIRLSEEQANILYTTTYTQRLAVAGCAGSGKTLLAMLIARRLADEGERVLLCCFNRPLCDYLRTVLNGTRIGRTIRTATFYELCRELASELNVPLSIDSDTDSDDGIQILKDTIQEQYHYSGN